MHRVRRIGQAEVRERIGEQKITEAVRHAWGGHGMVSEKGECRSIGTAARSTHGGNRPIRQCASDGENGGTRQGDGNQNDSEPQFDEVARAESQRVLHGQEESEKLRQHGAELFSRAVISSGQAVRMNFRTALLVSASALACLGTVVYAFQKPFRQYPGVEYRHFETPADYQEKTEFAFARLMFPGGWNDGITRRRGASMAITGWVSHSGHGRIIRARTGTFRRPAVRRLTPHSYHDLRFEQPI